MKGASRDFFTGLVALAGLGGLAALLFIFGEVRNVFASTYEFQMRVDHAAGLRPTSDVALQGVRIGTVVWIANASDDPQHGVDIRVKVRGDARIPRDFTLYLDKGFVGDAVLDLQVPSGTPVDGSRLVRENEVLPGTRSIDSLFRRVETAMAEPLERIGHAADRVAKLGESAGDLFEPRTLAEVRSGKPANLSSTFERIDQVLANADRWLGDDALHADARAIAASAREAITEVSTTAASLRETADSIRITSDSARSQIETQGARLADSADRITGAITQTLGRIDSTAGEIQKIATGINAGEGTIGQLARNPDLYHSVRDAAVRLDRALTELQMLLEKLKDEGIPVNF